MHTSIATFFLHATVDCIKRMLEQQKLTFVPPRGVLSAHYLSNELIYVAYDVDDDYRERCEFAMSSHRFCQTPWKPLEDLNLFRD